MSVRSSSEPSTPPHPIEEEDFDNPFFLRYPFDEFLFLDETISSEVDKRISDMDHKVDVYVKHDFFHMKCIADLKNFLLQTTNIIIALNGNGDLWFAYVNDKLITFLERVEHYHLTNKPSHPLINTAKDLVAKLKPLRLHLNRDSLLTSEHSIFLVGLLDVMKSEVMLDSLFKNIETIFSKKAAELVAVKRTIEGHLDGLKKRNVGIINKRNEVYSQFSVYCHHIMKRNPDETIRQFDAVNQALIEQSKFYDKKDLCDDIRGVAKKIDAEIIKATNIVRSTFDEIKKTIQAFLNLKKNANPHTDWDNLRKFTSSWSPATSK